MIPSTGCRQFSLAEIQSAIGDFSDEHVIGKGGFGKVYKGLVDNGSASVAIKRGLASQGKGQGQTEFAAEIETLTQFRHRNLVSLIGYCNEEGEMILVYDYTSKGTLADHLYNQSTLSWNQLLKICIGAGRGLDYLHSGCSIIHRDVKPTNILLDENFIAKVSDFGLAKHLGHDILQTLTDVKGSFGYLDPSYVTTSVLTMGSDTYAFGIILEVLSGIPAVDKKMLVKKGMCMSMWAQEKIRNGKADQIVALDLKGEISEVCLKTFVGVVKRCLHPDPKKRLTMTRVVAQLELALEQQERKKLQFWPFWNRVIPSGSTPKDQNEVEGIPFILFGEAKSIDAGFSPMYNEFAGVLKNGEDATIERLHYMPKHEFKAEFSRPLSNLKHMNVAELVVYNLDGLQQVLAYDFAPRGSLHSILHEQQGIGSSSNPYLALTWSQRIQIALGVARGLCYIHDHDKELIHHNIRSNNVLLCDDDTAKILDPFLWTQCNYCRTISSKECHPSLLSAHTQGCDMNNFGEVLLELLTGSKIVDNKQREGGQHHLVSWVCSTSINSLSDKVHEIVDARIKADYPFKAVKKMAQIAKLCLQVRDSFCPNMGDIVKHLELCLLETKSQHTLGAEVN